MHIIILTCLSYTPLGCECQIPLYLPALWYTNKDVSIAIPISGKGQMLSEYDPRVPDTKMMLIIQEGARMGY